jgi:hypothetical protein
MQIYTLYFNCPETKQMRCPVNACKESVQDAPLLCLAHGFRSRPRNMEKKIPTVHRPIDTVNTTRALVRKPA